MLLQALYPEVESEEERKKINEGWVWGFAHRRGTKAAGAFLGWHFFLKSRWRDNSNFEHLGVLRDLESLESQLLIKTEIWNTTALLDSRVGLRDIVWGRSYLHSLPCQPYGPVHHFEDQLRHQTVKIVDSHFISTAATADRGYRTLG